MVTLSPGRQPSLGAFRFLEAVLPRSGLQRVSSANTSRTMVTAYIRMEPGASQMRGASIRPAPQVRAQDRVVLRFLFGCGHPPLQRAFTVVVVEVRALHVQCSSHVQSSRSDVMVARGRGAAQEQNGTSRFLFLCATQASSSYWQPGA